MHNIFIMIIAVFALVACTGASEMNIDEGSPDLRFLALGDSYTIGASVNSQERWPAQLAALLKVHGHPGTGVNVTVTYRATTGWTTSNLLSSLQSSPPSGEFDIVSLLIGVNNQYQGRDFSIYETDVPQLVDLALHYAGGRAERVFVLSIPDYAYTPFGQSRGEEAQALISAELAIYDDWMRAYVESRDIVFFNITPITRRGLDEPDLVAGDGLHPSGKAYTEFAGLVLQDFDWAWMDAMQNP